MKQVKVSELKDGDIFIDEGRYYVVIDATHKEWEYIRVECFMAPTGPNGLGIDIGDVIYIPTYRKVLLCKPTPSNS